MSTEPAEHKDMERRDDLRYAIPSTVKVRKETFGLLFYSTEESRLTFVKSKDLLRIDTLPGGKKMISAGVKPQSRARVGRLLDHLLKKGLICDS